MTVRWEYTVTPASPVRRFACASDRDEFYDMITDVPATSAWYMTPRPGVHANDRAAFELLQFTVDGQEQKIRRSERKTGQTYTVNLGADVVRDGKPVRIGHTYQTVTAQAGHRLHFAIAQPTKDLSVTLDYSDTNIADLSVNGLIQSADKVRVMTLPEAANARTTTIEVPGWVLPQAGVTFVWTLTGEEAGLRDPEVLASAV